MTESSSAVLDPTPAPTLTLVAGGDITAEAERYERKLRSDVQNHRKSPRTVTIYTTGVRLFVDFLHEQGMPTATADIKPVHCEAFMAALLDTRKPATCKSRFQALKGFFAWLVDEEEIPANPMRRMPTPSVPLPDEDGLLSGGEVLAMFDTCKGKDFAAVRDNAILRLFADTGVRLSELWSLTLPDDPSITNPRTTPFLDMANQVVHVIGKGSKGKPKPRSVPFNDNTAAALDKYLRLRTRKLAGKAAPGNALWLQARGIVQLGQTGVAMIVDKAGRKAGVGHVHPHQFRHFAANRCLEAGMQEGDVMRLFGWSKRDMLDRYGRSNAVERAQAAFHRLVPPL